MTLNRKMGSQLEQLEKIVEGDIVLNRVDVDVDDCCVRYLEKKSRYELKKRKLKAKNFLRSLCFLQHLYHERYRMISCVNGRFAACEGLWGPEREALWKTSSVEGC